MGQDQNQGDQQDQLSQAGHQQAYLGLTKGHEALLAADLGAAGKYACHIDPHGPGGIFRQLGIGSEDPRKDRRKQQYGNAKEGGIAQADHEYTAEGFLYPVCQTGTVVVADNGLS